MGINDDVNWHLTNQIVQNLCKPAELDLYSYAGIGNVESGRYMYLTSCFYFCISELKNRYSKCP